MPDFTHAFFPCGFPLALYLAHTVHHIRLLHFLLLDKILSSFFSPVVDERGMYLVVLFAQPTLRLMLSPRHNPAYTVCDCVADGWRSTFFFILFCRYCLTITAPCDGDCECVRAAKFVFFVYLRRFSTLLLTKKKKKKRNTQFHRGFKPHFQFLFQTGLDREPKRSTGYCCRPLADFIYVVSRSFRRLSNEW